jgi:RecB family exonuclease
VLDRFVAECPDTLPPDAGERLMARADAVLEEAAPWPAARRLWRARLARVVPWFLETEAARREIALPWLREVRGDWAVDGLPSNRPLRLTAKADRIDRLPDGRIAIYDYKSGKVPTEKEERGFSKQLWLEAAMAADGAFSDGIPLEAATIAYIGLGAKPGVLEHHPAAHDIAALTAEFRRLLAHFQDPRAGFPSRRAVRNTAWSGDYDQLARYGEWDETDPATRLPVGEHGP